MSQLLFGTAGIPLSTPSKTTIDGIIHVKTLGLDAMEIEFVRQVYLNEASAEPVAKIALETGVQLSAHAPYHLNLNAVEPQKRRISQALLYRAARIGSFAGAKSIVFHPGYYLKNTPDDTYNSIFRYLSEIEEQLEEEGHTIKLMPETTGKLSQFGTLEETLKLCKSLKNATPCIDFAHLHAYQGQVNSYNEFSKVLETIKTSLGAETLNKTHIHLSGIHYGARGELKHLVLDESDFNYTELLQALIDAGCSGTVICESPNMEQDALLLKQKYLNLKRK